MKSHFEASVMLSHSQKREQFFMNANLRADTQEVIWYMAVCKGMLG